MVQNQMTHLKVVFVLVFYFCEIKHILVKQFNKLFFSIVEIFLKSFMQLIQ